jgi:hypothetical protein
VYSTVRELDARERPVLVGVLAHEREVVRILGIPDAHRDDGPEVGVLAHEGLFRADGRPAAFGLHAAEAGLRAGLLRAEARAMRNGVETVPKRLRADPDRLEEDVVTRIAGH